MVLCAASWKAAEPDLPSQLLHEAASLELAHHRGPKDHINIRISHSGLKAQYKGESKIVVGRILVFKWSFGPLHQCLLTGILG